MNLARYKEPRRRRCLVAFEGELCPTRLAPVVECHFIFGGDRTTQQQTDRSIAASEATIATEGAAQAGAGAIAIGAQAEYREAGSIGRDQNIEGGVSIVTSDPATVAASLQLARDLASQTAAVAKESNEAAQFLAGQSVSALAAVREAEAAGGSALWRNVVTVLGLSLAAVLAIKFWRKA